ncbi:CFS_G0024200.mRNA.1.CDS.1 [Saccharomyces cerevisiae]|nr:CFS_G0024200.mRNA.1.CDS.1 [Saccharomyces cerevisiae]CAI7333069.1 CFS_G0024200.mRNA.1.CDS.1 [Saccharomyces cerevisiae]
MSYLVTEPKRLIVYFVGDSLYQRQRSIFNWENISCSSHHHSKKLDRDGYFNYQNPASLLGNPDLRYRRRIWGQGELVQYLPVTLDQEYTCHESIKYVKKNTR